MNDNCNYYVLAKYSERSNPIWINYDAGNCLLMV